MPKQLPDLKNYLYSSICKALVSYHESDINEIKELEKIKNKPLFNSRKIPQTWRAKVHYHEMKTETK